MTNHLAGESSPYLLQHAENPVEWHPWGPAALERSKRENKPIFLSIGYSACHWCHVMEHESFENHEIARLMNEYFINIKVDREERPDLDQIYMNAVQLLTGHGGWPMSVFLTPELEPFYGGTYFPPHASRGMPGFDQILEAVHEAWENRRDQAQAQARQLTAALGAAGQHEAEACELSQRLLDGAEAAYSRYFDSVHGGFGRAPKFPHPMDLRVLLRTWRRRKRDPALDMVRLTLDKMAGGGIYDHLGGGFHRYSVDAHWLVPHFEKMLYDNALLAGCYTEAYQATGNAEYARVLRETLDYILREMTGPEGGFYSTQDADSEGEEGKFYVWTPAQIQTVLGDARAETFCQVYDVTPAGNFEGHNILNRPKTPAQSAALLGRDPGELAADLAQCRRELLAVRNGRVWPNLDDKVIVSWNALMIDAMALAGCALGEPAYVAAAARAADFILTRLRRADGRLLHSWRSGNAKFDAYLDDYTYLINALVTLYEATFDERWIDEAVRLADLVLAQFADRTTGGFYFTASDHEALIARNKDAHDASVPSGNGMAATALLRLGRLTGRDDYTQAAAETLQLYSSLMRDSPSAAGQMLLALDLQLGPLEEIVLLGDGPETRAALDALWRRFVPAKVVALRSPSAPNQGSPHLAPLFAGKQPIPPGPTLFVCQRFTCQSPVSGKEAVIAEWERL